VEKIKSSYPCRESISAYKLVVHSYTEWAIVAPFRSLLNNAKIYIILEIQFLEIEKIWFYEGEIGVFYFYLFSAFLTK
jgi:NADH:ubiquinone oxidoreductase subunit 6 (subunit J)